MITTLSILTPVLRRKNWRNLMRKHIWNKKKKKRKGMTWLTLLGLKTKLSAVVN